VIRRHTLFWPRWHGAPKAPIRPDLAVFMRSFFKGRISPPSVTLATCHGWAPRSLSRRQMLRFFRGDVGTLRLPPPPPPPPPLKPAKRRELRPSHLTRSEPPTRVPFPMDRPTRMIYLFFSPSPVVCVVSTLSRPHCGKDTVCSRVLFPCVGLVWW